MAARVPVPRSTARAVEDSADDFLPPRRRAGLARRLGHAARGTAGVALIAGMLALLALDLSVCFAPFQTGVVIHEVRTDLFGAEYRLRSVTWHEVEE